MLTNRSRRRALAGPVEGGLRRSIFAAVRAGSGEHPAVRAVLGAVAASTPGD